MIYKQSDFSKVDLYLISFSGYLFCFLPLVILTGPFLPDLFISTIALLFLYLSFKYRLKKYYFNKFFIIFALFYLYLVVNSILSEFTNFSIQSSVVYFRFGISASQITSANNFSTQYLDFF